MGWLVLRARCETIKEIEILVLRHQLAVLQRRTPRPPTNWTERALIATLTRLLSTPRRLGLVVTPATILRWHRQLVALPALLAAIASGLLFALGALVVVVMAVLTPSQ